MTKKYKGKFVISTIICLILGLFLSIQTSPASETSLPCDFHGYETPQTPLNIGDVITVKDPNGVLCGSYTVDTKGQYGFLTCLGDDLNTATMDEGAVEGDTITFFLNGEEVEKKGIWKEGGTVQVDIDNLKNYETVSLDIHKAYNPIAFSVIPDDLPSPYKASQLIKDLAEQGINVRHVMQWDYDWIPHRVDLSFTDFNLDINEGIFVEVISPNKYYVGTWNVKGKKIALPKEVQFRIGWNLISLPTTINATTAKELYEQINSQDINVDQIMWWDGDDWCIYWKWGELSLGNYELVKGRSYFFHCKKQGIWQMQ